MPERGRSGSGSKIGILQSAPAAVLHVSGTQPAASGVNGTAATSVLNVVGGKGGNTTTGGHTGGTGGGISLLSGAGGNAVGGSTNGNRGVFGVGGVYGVYGVYGVSPEGVHGAASGFDGIAVFGFGSGGSQTTGVYGTSSNYRGVVGNTASGLGVYGESSSSGRGVVGTSTSGSGVEGFSTSGDGVYATSTGGVGVYGQSAGSDGVRGRSSSGSAADVSGVNSTSGYSVYGTSSGGYAGYFDGKVYIAGPLIKPAGSFQIDHPLDPANQYLSHSFVESPDMKTIYDGVAVLDTNGEAVVNLPDWLEALNRDFRYQLTCIGGFAPVYIAQKIQNNQFRIAGGSPGLEVSWQVTGVRQDAWAKAHPLQVEQEKSEKERGYYLSPTLFGQPEEKSVERVRNPELSRERVAAGAAGKAAPTPPAGLDQ